MANTVTITITIPAATSSELDLDTGKRIANEATEHVLRALGSKTYTATNTVTSS